MISDIHVNYAYTGAKDDTNDVLPTYDEYISGSATQQNVTPSQIVCSVSQSPTAPPLEQLTVEAPNNAVTKCRHLKAIVIGIIIIIIAVVVICVIVVIGKRNDDNSNESPTINASHFSFVYRDVPITLHMEFKTYAEAVSICRSFGGRLLLITSRSMHEMVYASTITRTPGDMRIAGVRIRSNLPYFKDDQGSPLSYYNWGSGEPNNQGGYEFCIEIKVELHGGWNDINCNIRKPFLCEQPRRIELNSPVYKTVPPTIISAGHNSFYYGNIHIVLHREFKTYAEAVSICSSFGGRLLRITSRHMHEQVYTSTKTRTPDNMRIAGVRIGSNLSYFKDDQGSPLSYYNWGSGEPNNQGGDESCIEIRLELQGGWNDINCNIRKPFLCDQPRRIELSSAVYKTVPPTINAGHYSLEYGDIHIILYTKLKTYKEARNICRSIGGRLLRITSWGMHEMVYSSIKTQTLQDIMIAGFRNGSNRHDFKDEEGNPLNYYNWGFGEPNYQSANEACIEIKHVFLGSWNDIDCNMRKPFLCSVTYKNVTPTSKASHYSFLYGSIYIVLHTEIKTHEEAASICRSVGGRLLRIESRSMYLKIHAATITQTPDHMWIAGVRFGSNRYDFRDDKGNPLVYYNWALGEPNNRGGNESCIEIRLETNRGWNDINCNTRRPFLCKQPQRSKSSTVALKAASATHATPICDDKYGNGTLDCDP